MEKRSEKACGKKRLVIDYKPLNAFLKDDKFPLPKINSPFVHIREAHIFSKFDLKTGFWQLGTSPDERPKIAFCIPNTHYQWKVLPFGLKVAPSLFQKAMTKIFQPIMHHTLVYIDDLLLFSKDAESHYQLSQRLWHIKDLFPKRSRTLQRRSPLWISIQATAIKLFGKFKRC